ncbi:hypothetical protein Bbelb_256110 [Branchiostoma belcheri]|nr:hypothetical protein Bbelb_256110 [Branchiostoma belcheri]
MPLTVEPTKPRFVATSAFWTKHSPFTLDKLVKVTSDTERVSDIRQSPAWAAAMEQMQDRRCFVFGLNTDGVNPDRILPCHNTTHIRTCKQSNQFVVPLPRTNRYRHPFDSSIAIASACVVTFRTLREGHDRYYYR